MSMKRQAQKPILTRHWALRLCVLALLACGGGAAHIRPSGDGPGDVAPIARVTGNPFRGVEFFVPTYTNADQARRRMVAVDPGAGALLAKIADTPQARWFGGWSGDIQIVVNNYVRVAHKHGKASLLVAYNIPNRDCGQYSAGGAEGADGYKKWVTDFANGIGDQARAVVVLEPDALGHLSECLSEADQAIRLSLLNFAVEQFHARPGVSVYIDAGHSRWMKPEVAAERLRLAGVNHARGFALNVSNYIADEELIDYGQEISKLLGGVAFLIDSSRNGNGPTADAAWCNPAGRALGQRPTAQTGVEFLDAFAWVKAPGESDGRCEGGPKAGDWFEERALEMARNAKW